MGKRACELKKGDIFHTNDVQIGGTLDGSASGYFSAKLKEIKYSPVDKTRKYPFTGFTGGLKKVVKVADNSNSATDQRWFAEYGCDQKEICKSVDCEY